MLAVPGGGVADLCGRLRARDAGQQHDRHRVLGRGQHVVADQEPAGARWSLGAARSWAVLQESAEGVIWASALSFQMSSVRLHVIGRP